MIDRELRDEKAVRVAIGQLYRGEYEIELVAEEKAEDEATESVEADAE